MIFGDLERLLAQLYPYRLPIAIGLVIVLAPEMGSFMFGFQRWTPSRFGRDLGSARQKRDAAMMAEPEVLPDPS